MTAQQYKELMARRRGPQPAAAAAVAQRRPAAHPGLPSVPEPPALEPLLAGLSGVGRTWSLLMPYAEKMLTSNQRLHWRREHEIRKQLRADATSLIAAHRLPRLQRAAIFYVLHPRPLKRSRDPGNWSPTAKAYVDGLVTPTPERPSERHLLPDDDHEHLLGPNPVMGAPVTTGYARMTLVIVELVEPVTSGNAETVTGTSDPTYRS
ncbi:hypothetical protein [Streptomyces griseomycini]|uniref:Uncharacterized protein n=1 Tax=Streptomyces griseomycini TaxID=66895 RepID=A0A7W7PWG1_9ACTN|nr:hypothetical protein [Streptomyces griseomycini]MBB4902545.1 hypothetical protein [Streptomyces griseomycini]